MSLKENITTSYGASIYKKTTELKKAKMKMAKAKNQFIFLQRCLAHQLIPKSFWSRSEFDGLSLKLTTEPTIIKLTVAVMFQILQSVLS